MSAYKNRLWMLPVGHNKLYIMKDLGQSYLNMSQNKSF